MIVRALVPSYFDPVGEGLKQWEMLIHAAQRISIIAIANPNSGPGAAADQAYDDIIFRATHAGIRVVGYVSTKYGQRPVSEIYDDIRRWVDYYRSTSGIFFDEQSKDDNDVALYRELFAYARNAIGNALVVGNPGVIPSERYTSEAGADLECLFESEESFDLFVPPDWTIEYPDRFCVLLLNVSHADSMKKHLRKAFHEGIGTVYATNRKTNGNSQNPWDSLPKYWDDEVDTLIQLT